MPQIVKYSVLALIIGLALGRYTIPARTVHEHDVETEKHVADHSTVTRTQKPDGTVITITHKDVAVQADRQTQNKVEVDNSTEKWSLSLTAGIRPLKQEGLVYGAQMSYRLLGPVQVGAWGILDGTLGVSLGLRF